MNILVSNDDGINSPALHELVKQLSKIGDVYVVAPDSERSANSHHFTYAGRLRLEQRPVEGAKKAYALWGTPCDCIHAGLQYIIKEKMDIVVSGINLGWNVSSDMVYSGTVAAAREAFMQGVPSIAVSLAVKTYGKQYGQEKYTYAAKIASEAAKKFVNDENNKNYFLNINVPDLPEEEIKGTKVTENCGFIEYNEGYITVSEFGVDYITSTDITSTLHCDPEDLSIDISAINKGYVTYSPLYVDQINHKYVQDCKNKWEK